MKAFTTAAVLSLVPALFTDSAAAQHLDDIIVGRSAAGQLKFEAGLDEVHLLLPVNPPLSGWTGDEPGFDHLEVNEPDEDFFVLGAGAEVWLEGISLDAALRVYRNDLGAAILSPGQQILLGDHLLHTHVIWNISSSDPGFDPGQEVWSGTFKLVDKGVTGYAESEPFTLRFTNIPEPATLVMLAAGGLALVRRRRAHAREASR
jgi:hypothetical protein